MDDRGTSIEVAFLLAFEPREASGPDTPPSPPGGARASILRAPAALRRSSPDCGGQGKAGQAIYPAAWAASSNPRGEPKTAVLLDYPLVGPILSPPEVATSYCDGPTRRPPIDEEWESASGERTLAQGERRHALGGFEGDVRGQACSESDDEVVAAIFDDIFAVSIFVTGKHEEV